MSDVSPLPPTDLAARFLSPARAPKGARKDTLDLIAKVAGGRLVRDLVREDSAFATVIYGEGVTEEQAAEVEALLRRENKDMEITVVDGGQPVYYYILSVE